MKFSEISKGFIIFLVINVLLGMTLAVEVTSIGNRLYEELDLTVMQRSVI